MIPHNRYPVGLVPYVGLKTKIEIPDLTRPENQFDVARRVRKDKVTIVDLDDDYLVIPHEMLSDVFPLRDIPDLSMNIMSRDSVADYVNYGQYDAAHEDWNGKTVFPHKYFRLIGREETVALVFRAKDFHLIPYPYYKAVQGQAEFDDLLPYIDREDEKTRKLLDEKFKKGNEYQVIGRFILEHKPSMMNYWHITLVIHENGSGKIVKKVKNAAEKELCGFVVDHILSCKGEINKEKCKELHPIYYIDTNINTIRANICRWFRNLMTSSMQIEPLKVL